MAEIVDVTDSSFDEEVLESEMPVLVDFWAGWCAPCKMIAPIVEELAEEFAGQVKFSKMDVDSNSTTPSKYGIRGIPALLIFDGGSPVDQIVGAVPKSLLKSRIESAIGN